MGRCKCDDCKVEGCPERHSEAPPKKWNPYQEAVDIGTIKKKERIISKKVVVHQYKGPKNLMIIDQTRIGLNIDIFKEGNNINIVIHMPEKENILERYELNAIKTKRREITGIGPAEFTLE